MDLYIAFAEDDRCKLFPSEAFGYRKVTIERPLRLNFQVRPERIKRLESESAFVRLAESKKKDKAAKAAEEKEGRKLQQAILATLETMPKKLYKDRPSFEAALASFSPRPNGERERVRGLSLPAPVRKAVLNVLSDRDGEAEICRDKDGKPEPDSELRDYENVPLPSVPSPLKGEGKGEGESVVAVAVREYFDREVKPHVPDAWVNTQVRD